MKILPLKDADHMLVEIVKYPFSNYPHCKKHGAMNKLTLTGIWRCVSTYKIINIKQKDGTFKEKLIENNCRAGFQEG